MMEMEIKITEFERHLLLGLVLEQRMKYEGKAADHDTQILAKSFQGLHDKLHSAKPTVAISKS